MRWLASLALLALSACTTNFKPDHIPTRNRIVDTALSQVGVPYRHAGADPQTGFDCSGLIVYSYVQAGIKLPRSSTEQLDAGREVPYRHAQPGDLLFYRFNDSNSSGSSNGLHVVMFTGGTAGIHAPGNGRGVSLVRLDQPAWTNRYITAVNVLMDLPPETPVLQQNPASVVPDSTAVNQPAPSTVTLEVQEENSNPEAADYGASMLRE